MSKSRAALSAGALRGPGVLLLLAACAAGLLFSLVLVLHAHGVNGQNGFPLDDPWIHLTFARNLHDHHAFTYFPGDPPTPGSTSPLYTLLLALGFGCTRDEKVLCYVLGILFQVSFLATLAAWAHRRLGSALWATAAVLLVGLDDSTGILSASGMETSLFLFLVAAAFLARVDAHPARCGIALGLAVWARPDGFILIVVFGLDAVLEWLRAGGRHGRQATPAAPGHPLRRFALPLLVLVAAYFAFDLAVGGALLPNTFAAKTATYRLNPRRLFFSADIVPTFFDGGWILLIPFALFALVREAVRLVRPDSRPSPPAPRGPVSSRLEAGWTIGLLLAYLVLLPYGHRFGRYLVPALPAVAILGLGGLQAVVRAAGRRRSATWARDPAALAAGVLLFGMLALHLQDALRAVDGYAALCRYHAVRHERTGRWLAAETPPDAVVATHDVGAIAYYSERRIVDVAGVILVEAVEHLHTPGYVPYLEDLFARKHVTHLAVIRDWLGVDNVAPLFTADPRPEVMEVYPWMPGKTHLVPDAANNLARQGEQLLRGGNVRQAVTYLRAAVRVDDRSARLWTLLGRACEEDQDPTRAVDCYRRALALFPEADDARFRLAAALAKQGDLDAARVELGRLLARTPGYPRAQELERQLGE